VTPKARIKMYWNGTMADDYERKESNRINKSRQEAAVSHTRYNGQELGNIYNSQVKIFRDARKLNLSAARRSANKPVAAYVKILSLKAVPRLSFPMAAKELYIIIK